MKPAPTLRRARPLKCGCLTGPAVLLVPRCREAERLWGEVRALGERATSLTEEWMAYRDHFQARKGKR